MKLFSFAILLLGSSSLALPAQTFTCGAAKAGATQLRADSAYSAQAAGFDLKTRPEVAQGFCSSKNPFFFSVSVPEGNYRVTVELGSPEASVTTMRAESRRLMLEKMATAAGKSTRRSFDVNVRYQRINGDPANLVHLKPREDESLDWDQKLTLEFNGEHPGFRSITIAPVNEPTIYLAGDSTVVDQRIEPWTAWGQILPRFFHTGVAISNQAESGETVRSFENEKRFEKVFSTLKKGDYLLFQFAHNDQKPENHVPLELYRKLLATYIDKTRAAGATPVLVTSMMRRAFDDQGKIKDTFAGYPQAMREVATEKHVTLIDLNAMSKTLWEAMGVEGSLKAFVHYPANTFPGQSEAIADNTHFNGYGAYELARCMVLGIQNSDLALKKWLTPDAGHFDPAHPDPQPSFSLPFTPIPAQEGDVTKARQI
jgi:lysophospholipase L1-like esterase